jgi:threonine/homoserine/homoserine lactone efflux protein
VLAHAAAFLAVSALVIVTPGQDTALTIRNTLARGRRGGVHTAAGVALGQLVWALAASAGLVALLHAWGPAFLALRIAGAAYLLYLGLTALHSALTRTREPSAALEQRLRTPPLVQGLLSNLGNPKMAVFFTSLLPQFAPHGSFVALFALGAVFCALTLTWLSGYALAVSRASELLRRSRPWRAIEALTGAVLVALGVRVAAASV